MQVRVAHQQRTPRKLRKARLHEEKMDLKDR